MGRKKSTLVRAVFNLRWDCVVTALVKQLFHTEWSYSLEGLGTTQYKELKTICYNEALQFALQHELGDLSYGQKSHLILKFNLQYSMISSSFKNNFVIIIWQDKNEKTEISLAILLWFALINVLFLIFFHFSSNRCHMSLAGCFDIASDGEKRSAFRKMNSTSVC